MNSPFTAYGTQRWEKSPDVLAKLQALHADVRARHADALVVANPFQRLVIRWRMRRDFQRERKRLLPSAHTLYSSSAMKLELR